MREKNAAHSKRDDLFPCVCTLIDYIQVLHAVFRCIVAKKRMNRIGCGQVHSALRNGLSVNNNNKKKKRKQIKLNWNPCYAIPRDA